LKKIFVLKERNILFSYFSHRILLLVFSAFRNGFLCRRMISR